MLCFAYSSGRPAAASLSRVLQTSLANFSSYSSRFSWLPPLDQSFTFPHCSSAVQRGPVGQLGMLSPAAVPAFVQLGSQNGKNLQKSDGLPSPERSGSPDLNTRSSQWKRDHPAYASKEDAHQIDDWPEARHSKCEDVLVRYKDTRGSKGLSTRMDPHAWSDLPTDTDDEVADNATSPIWNGANDACFAPKADLDISAQQLKTAVPRNFEGVRTQSELVNIRYFASEDHWETVALDDASRQVAETTDALNERVAPSKKLLPATAFSQDGRGSSCQAADGERVGPPGRVPTLLRHFPGRLGQKEVDEQASLKMSHRYYTSGVETNRKRSIPSRVVAAGKEAESGQEKNVKLCGRKRTEKAGMDSKFKIRNSSDLDSIKELADSSTSDDSDCSDAEFGMSSSRHCDEEAEESFREMILQKYLVMLPEKAKKIVRASADTKQKEGRCKSQATTGEPPHSRKLNGKNLHSVSPSRRQRFQLRKSLKKNPYMPLGPPRPRSSVSQPVGALQANVDEAIVSPREEESETGKPISQVALLRKSWSTGDLHHSKSLGDIGSLIGHALSQRDMEKSLSKQKNCAIDFQFRLAKDAKAFFGDASQKLASGERCPAMANVVVQHTEKTCFPHKSEEEQHRFINFGIQPVEVSTTAAANLPLTKISDEGYFCDCLNSPSVLQVASKTQLGGAMEAAESQWQGRVPEQGLRALAMLPGPAETSEMGLKSSADDPVVVPYVGVPARGQSVDGSEGSHCIHENPMAKEQVKLHSKGASESSDGGSTHRAAAKQAQGAEEARNGFSKQSSFVKKVTAVIPFDSRGDAQVLPDVSLAGQPASHIHLELQHEVEYFKHHVADEQRQQVRNNQRTLPEQYWGTEKIAQQKKGFWAESQDLQKEKQNLLKRLQELEAHHPCNRLKAMSGTKVQLTELDTKKLRQEILEQEALIRGYQVENEKAVAKIREVQLEAKQKLQEMAEEKALLASQLVNRQMLGYGTDSASLHEKLQGALSRETALRIDLDKMRDSYNELEKRSKREESSRVKDMELKLTSLQETLGAERQSNTQMESRKQAMIQQEELIASLQETVSDQASKIRSLTSRLESGEEQEKKGAQLQIETLQNQIKQLEASLCASKKETGLHVLQVAKSGMEENETFRRLQAELMDIQRNALQRDEETNRIIHHLKVENDKLKHESATRIRNLTQRIQTQAKSGHSISESELSALNRVKDLEKQVANLRLHYSRKVKELTDKLEEAKPVEVISRNKPYSDNIGPQARVATTRLQPAQGKALREAKERIALQADVLCQKDRKIKSLQKQIQALETNGTGPTVVPPTEGEKRAKPAAREVHCTVSTHKQGSPNKGTACPRTGSYGNANDAASADEVAELRRQLQKSELTREVLQKTCNESVEKTVLLTLQHQQALQLQQIRQSQMNHHHRSTECQPTLAGTRTSTLAGGWGDHRSGLEGMNWLSEQGALEMTNRAFDARLKVMSDELDEADTMCQQSPRMTQIMNLKRKVAEMESCQQQKELEWKKLLQETKQTSSMEQEYAERKWQEALASKSMEVERIRLELNTILEAAMAMQHAQMQMNHKI